MVAMFVFLPGVFMGLSFAGTAYVIVAAGFIVSIFLFVLLVNLLRAKVRKCDYVIIIIW